MSIWWAEPEEVCVLKVTCKCGHTEDYSKEPNGKIFWHEDVWECPACHAKARFIYRGWVLEEVKDSVGS
jgi:hypothetical protein